MADRRPGTGRASRVAADRDALSWRGVAILVVVAVVVSLCQSPGAISPDTKLDLALDPGGFLSRALHLWSSIAPMGQVQNQAYGYLFPHGTFFLLGDAVGLPAWLTQRLWWALLVVVGFLGIVRLAEALAVGSRGSRLVAAAAFVVSPRVLTTVGSISSETLPMMLAPWVLIPVVLAFRREPENGPDQGQISLRRLAFRSACAIALMGAVNAVATAAGCGAALVWWLMHARLRGSGSATWWRFTGWWALGSALACAWWVVPLAILSRVSPPFLDYIESSRVTTRWTSLVEVLRGTSSWTPFVSPDRVAGAVLVSSPVAVLATGAVAAAGLAGLAMRSMPARGRLVVLIVVGVILMCSGFVGELGSPVAEPVRAFLDGPGAPLRNVHKVDPVIRTPIVLGIAHLLGRVPLPGTVDWRSAVRAFAHPERSRLVAASAAFLVILAGAGSMVWTGQLAPQVTFPTTPSWWSQTAAWLSAHGGSPATPDRALVVPGAPFAIQTWGLTRDEPIQPLARTPWAVRDAIPLTPPGAIRAMDSVQRQIASGRPSAGLAATLAEQGITYVVLRSDLASTTSRSARPIVARQAVAGSPGMRRVAQFGPMVGPRRVRGVVADDGLAESMRAIEIFAVESTASTGNGTGPSLVDVDAMPRVVGGPESLARLQEHAAMTGTPPPGPSLLAADARRAGVPDAGSGAVVTDTPTDRETDFGRVDEHSSAIRAPGDPRRTQNTAPDYPVPGAGLVHGRWLLDGQPDEVSVTASGSASDATQLGQTSPSNSPAAAFDGDPNTSWISRDLTRAVGQWLQVDFTRPRAGLAVAVTPGRALGSPVTSLLVTTEAGSTVTQGLRPGEPTTVVAPSGPTRWVQVRAIGTADGGAGSQFAIAEMRLKDTDAGRDLSVTHQTVLPDMSPGDRVSGWDLGQELGSRSACATGAVATRCSSSLDLPPEEPGLFTRVLSVPQSVTVAPRVWVRAVPGPALDAIVADPRSVTASGPAAVTDPRGSASAVVDGDVGTSWVAPDDSAATGSAPPALQIRLPTPRRIDALRITVPTGRYPARPTRVAVDLGDGRQVRRLPTDGRIVLQPRITDTIAVSVLDADDLVNVNSLGYADPAPTGIAEVSVDGQPFPIASPSRSVTIGCDRGLTASVAGQTRALSVTASARELVDGAPVQARLCGSAQTVALPAGQQTVVVTPSDVFTVDSMTLDVPGAAPPSDRARPVTPTRWSDDLRTVTVDAASRDRVLRVPESINPGWRATLGGTALRPITVDGWQQGWIVPAGAGGTVTMRYPLDTPYRWALLVGLIAVAVLMIATLVPARRRTSPTAATPAPIRAPAIATLGALIGAWVLSGWVGVALAAIVGVLAVVARRRRPRWVPAAVAAAFGLGAAGLSYGPWNSGDPYTGFAWWVTAPALAAVAVLVAVSLPPSRFVARRLASRRATSRARIARRAGSSISP